jgi:hypothetical protein
LFLYILFSFENESSLLYCWNTIENENEMSKILKKNYDKLRYQLKTLGLNLENIPDAPELTHDTFPSHASL